MAVTNKRMRFMDNNHAELTGGQITKSSEDADFPFSNAINKFRTKVWKPSGSFTIDSNNKTIYLDDTSVRSVDLTEGVYATGAALATHIQSTIGASWTVSYSTTTYKFTFTNPTTTYELRFSQTANAVWDTIGWVATADEAVGSGLSSDQPRAHTSEYAVFDLGYNALIEFIGVIGPLDQEFSISASATITLQANNLDQWDSPPFSQTLTRTPGGIFKFFDDLDDTDKSYRFWRFEFEDKLNPNPDFQISYIYLGDYTTLENRNLNKGFTKTINDPSLTAQSESGVLYFDRKTKFASFKGTSISFLDKTQRDTLEQLFFDFGKTTPLFVSIDPTECFSNDLYDLTKYVVFDDSPKFKHITSDKFSMSFSLREVI